MHSASQRKSRSHGVLHHALIEHRESTRQAQAHRTDVRVGWSAKAGAAAAEDLAVREELRVDFKSDDGFVIHRGERNRWKSDAWSGRGDLRGDLAGKFCEVVREHPREPARLFIVRRRVAPGRPRPQNL